jgi:hypothetical protein|tara:strand:- start:401 stop:766 length:366 start_codon:yes stop_codon:yes gene_type:complete
MRPIKKTTGIPYKEKTIVDNPDIEEDFTSSMVMPSEDYNMKRALELRAMGVPGFTEEDVAKADGHFPSVDPTTGMLLKSMDHPTVILEFLATMLDPSVGQLSIDPEGYFGEKQLRYTKYKK